MAGVDPAAREDTGGGAHINEHVHCPYRTAHPGARVTTPEDGQQLGSGSWGGTEAELDLKVKAESGAEAVEAEAGSWLALAPRQASDGRGETLLLGAPLPAVWVKGTWWFAAPGLLPEPPVKTSTDPAQIWGWREASS